MVRERFKAPTSKTGRLHIQRSRTQAPTTSSSVAYLPAGGLEEITCTAAGRALIDDLTAANQRTTLGLGTLATQSGTFSGTHSGTTSGTNTGDQTIILTGDVTGTGTGSFAATIATSAVTTTKIADDAVTYTKIQDTASTNVLLGRSSAGGGTIEEISCTAAGRALLNDDTAADQRSTLGLGTSPPQPALGSTVHHSPEPAQALTLATRPSPLPGAVTGSGTGSFTTTLASDVVAAANIQANAVTTSKINDSAVDEDKLGDQSTCIISSATPSGTGAFAAKVGSTPARALPYRWDGTVWIQEAGIQTVTVTDSTPLSVVVNNPDAFTANLTLGLDTQVANSVFAGPTTGADAEPTFRTLVPDDLPDATATTKGAINLERGSAFPPEP